MQVALHKLGFPSGFHVGAHGIGTESVRPTIPSDTLFSALLSAWVRLGGNPEAWASAFPRTRDGVTEFSAPPFLLSSAFPYAGGTLFFPNPLGYKPPDLPEDDEKTWKRVRFLSEPIHRKLVRGEDLTGLWPKTAEAKLDQLLQGGALLVAPSEAEALPKKLWEEREIPRVSLDRVTSASNLYTVGRVDFAPECGLWFAMAWQDPERDCGGVPFKEAFARALAELSRSGIGGDRSVGYGVFQHDILDEGVTWSDPLPERPAVLLSRYHPRQDELPDAITGAKAYSLEHVAGWGSSPRGQFRRRGLWMLAEGSVVRPSRAEVMGDLVDVAPQGETNPGHPVWRYGLALALPLEVRNAQED